MDTLATVPWANLESCSWHYLSAAVWPIPTTRKECGQNCARPGLNFNDPHVLVSHSRICNRTRTCSRLNWALWFLDQSWIRRDSNRSQLSHPMLDFRASISSRKNCNISLKVVTIIIRSHATSLSEERGIKELCYGCKLKDSWNTETVEEI